MSGQGQERWERYARLALEAVEIGAGVLLSERPSVIREKSDRDKATDLDERSEREIRAHLAEHAPEAGFHGEEEGPEGTDLAAEELLWLADPLDGTANMIRGIPLVSVSVALLHHGEPVVSAVAAPFLGSVYHAVRGSGAFVNGERVQVGRAGGLRSSIVTMGDFATGPNSESENRRRLALIGALAARAERVRMIGTAALDLSWLAEGRTQASLICGGRPWDLAGGALLAAESGATVTDLNGAPWSLSSPDLLAAAPDVSRELLEVMAEKSSETSGRA